MIKQTFRIGQGIDIHPFKEGRPLILGGVKIDSILGLDGHSDADVLVHAVIDAVLGAVGLGDIGEHFPDTDPKWQGANSLSLLETVWQNLCGKGWILENLDCTVLAEIPKIAPYRKDIINKLALVFRVSQDQISLKATTAEKLGFIGRREGILASAVCLLSKT